MLFLYHLRYAVRGFRREPEFALASVLTLGLGIGVAVAIFSVVYGVLLQPLPYAQPQTLSLVWKSVPKKSLDHDWTSYPTYLDWKRNLTGFEDLAVFLRPDASVVNLTEGDSVKQIQAAKVSQNFFQVLGTPPVFGRTLTPGERDVHVAIVSYDLWRQRFAGSPGALGKTIKLDGVIFTIAGVMPPKFNFPAKDPLPWSNANDIQVWIPISSDPRWTQFQTVRIADAFGVVGRLKPGVSTDQLQSQASALSRQLAREHPSTDQELDARVMPFSLFLVGSRIRLTLWLFVGAVLFVLMIACTNVAGLFLSRSFARRKSFAIQMALGADRYHILRQLFAEAIVLTFAAGSLGMGLAAMGVKLLSATAPANIPGIEAISLNGFVLAFAFLVSLLSALLSSLGPAWSFANTAPQNALKEKTESGPGNPMYHSLVFVECALAIVLLTATGLLLRSELHIHNVDLGFLSHRLLSLNVNLHGGRYGNDSQIRAFAGEAVRRVSSLPGVKSAAIGAVFLGGLPNSQLEVEGRPAAAAVVTNEPATWTYVSEGFFQTAGIPLLQGRAFTTSDGPNVVPVVIVNQFMARRLWPGQDPVGRRFKYNVPGSTENPWLTIVGVAGDTVQNGPETGPVNLIYYPARQKIWEKLVLLVRTDSGPESLEATIGSEVQRIDPSLPRGTISTIDQQLWEMGSQRRFRIQLFSVFSLLAVILAAVGVYSLMAYSVGQRTREIGVRMALGARRRDVLMMVTRQGLAPAFLGLFVGMGLSLLLSRALSGFLYGITPIDPVTYICVGGLLLIVAVTAAYVPTRRAMSVDPVIALRCE